MRKLRRLKVLIFYGGEAGATEKETLRFWLRNTEIDADAQLVADTPQGAQGAIDDRVDKAIRWADMAIAIVTCDPRSPSGPPNVIDEIARWRSRRRKAALCILRQRGTQAPSNLAGVPYLEFLNTVDECFDRVRPVIKAAEARAFIRMATPWVAAIVGWTLMVIFLCLWSYQKGRNALTETSIHPALGWQVSISIEAGEEVCLSPRGRVHTGVNQVVNFSQIAQQLMCTKWQNEATYPKELCERAMQSGDLKLTWSNRFSRQWAGPDGDETPNRFLQSCKLRPDLNWAALLMTVLPKGVAETAVERRDPIAIVKENSVEIVPLPIRRTFKAEQDGVLAFIVNDAVMSPDGDCLDMYNALNSYSKNNNDDLHFLPASAIPLIWYNDNVGMFSVLVQRGRCQQ